MCVIKDMLQIPFRVCTSEFCEQRPIMVSPTCIYNYAIPTP